MKLFYGNDFCSINIQRCDERCASCDEYNLDDYSISSSCSGEKNQKRRKGFVYRLKDNDNKCRTPYDITSDKVIYNDIYGKKYIDDKCYESCNECYSPIEKKFGCKNCKDGYSSRLLIEDYILK